MSQQDITEELIRKVEGLQKDLLNLQSQVPLYPIWNVATPAQFTAPQNNYDIGNHAILRLSSDAPRNLTGFAGGRMGRIIAVNIVGSNNIVFVDGSAASDPENRFNNPTAGTNITMAPRDSAILYYDGIALKWKFLSVSQ